MRTSSELGGYLHECGAHPIQHFYEKVIKVKADVAALLFLFFVAFATFPQKILR
jgi:hypothetical protein